MDAVVLAATTERIARTDLRDAFLELWASDAPMIGCVGIEPADAPAPSRRPEPVAVAAGAVAAGAGAAEALGAPALEPPAWEREASVGAYAAEVARAATPAPVAPAAPEPAAEIVARAARQSRAAEERGAERELEAALERDVRRGIVEKKATAKRGNLGILIGAVLGIAVVAGGLSALLSKRPDTPRGSIQATQPSGEEPIASEPSSGQSKTPGAPGSPAAPSMEQGNLDDPSAMAPSSPSAGEIGSVTALGKEIESAQVPPPSQAPGVASSRQPAPQPAAPAASRPPANREALRAGLGSAGVGSLPGAGPAADAAKPFRVHVASFRTESKVKEIVQALRAKKLDAWFEPPPPGGDWYRVFVGRFATEAEAATYAKWLIHSGAVDRAESYPQTKR
jgi:hypothetical protein